MAYDDDNVFAKILRGEVPCKKVLENERVLAFHDVSPQAPIHILVVPKGAYEDDRAFAERGGDAEIAALWRAVGEITSTLKLEGYRLIVNHGKGGGQIVPHLHIHILGGKPLGRTGFDRF